MVDSDKLDKRIRDSGYKYTYVALRLGITRASLRSKIDNKSEFRPSEIIALGDLIGVNSLEEREQLFFKR